MNTAKLNLECENADLKERLAKQVRRATDAEYMAHAYRNMLGPKGQEVAAMWSEKRVQRVHFEWGPGAADLTGEKRAETILALEAAPRTPVTFKENTPQIDVRDFVAGIFPHQAEKPTP